MSAPEAYDAAPRRVRHRPRPGEDGYVAVITALIFVTFAFGCAALAVDVAKWWVEGMRVQETADVASLAGVTYMPMDFSSATTAAVNVSARNGYPDSGDTSVDTEQGKKPSQLRVTVCSRVGNSFGAALGMTSTKVCRTALADYTGPAPMGSPCNTFGNEPNSGSGGAAPAGTARGSSPYSNCQRRPQFWANVAGPASDKANGDRFGTTTCSNGTATDGCTTGRVNSEYNPQGYFYLVRVQPAAVNQTIDLQLYDPEFANTTSNCSALPDASNFTSNSPNPFVNDAKTRYTPNSSASAGTDLAPFCNGDNRVGSQDQVVTSFALRQQTDTQNPASAPVQNDTSGSPCIKQFRGQTAVPNSNDLTSTKSTYDQQLARVFHNWYSLCSFTPARAGDYYLQVRTNISFGGFVSDGGNGGQADVISRGNTAVVTSTTGNYSTGGGNNSFSIRAVPPAGYEKQVAVAGYDRMPIFANADSASSTFNLIRVLPAGAGKSIAFTFFDVGDSDSGVGSVKVLPPTDAKDGSGAALTGKSYSVQFPGGCKALGGNAGTGSTYADCSAPIKKDNNNGRTETLNIPIPSDYTCSYTALNGCWYRVQVTFQNTTVTDTTTWTANITGDPVRLVE